MVASVEQGQEAHCQYSNSIQQGWVQVQLYLSTIFEYLYLYLSTSAILLLYLYLSNFTIFSEHLYLYLTDCCLEEFGKFRIFLT